MTDNPAEIFVGLMSGTSVDSIDAAAVKIENDNIELVASHTHEIPDTIRNKILELCQPGENEINRMGELDYELGELFSQATHSLLEKNNLSKASVSAIGSHGQTIRHMPTGSTPFTLQIGNPALIAENTQITTIADFRRADMAAGGQGAPLVPAFHHAVFADKNVNRVVLNIGGMANISILNAAKEICGFDTGPGNILLNEWISQEKNLSYDKNGEWSKENNVDKTLLSKMLSDPYFNKTPPKSTGREQFNIDWIRKHCENTQATAGTVQSTLCELTARTISDAVNLHANDTKEILVCGGGVHNKNLLERLRKHCEADVLSTENFGVDPDYVEAAAFAWFARQTLHKKSANAPAVTGAKHPVLLGAIYPV